MRKHFRTYCLLAVAVVAVALLSVSCIKDNDPAVGGKASVTMTFTTRVSDNVTAGNLLDNEQMRKLRVIVARSGTNDIIYNVSYDIQPGETQKVIHFSELTVNKDGENFDFYAIANEDAFLTGGESLEGKNVSLSALKSCILKKDFNSPALSKIPQAAFKTITVGPSENTSATMNLLFPLAKVVLNFDNQTGESVDLMNVAISGIANRGYLFKDIYANSYPQGTAGSGTVKFGNEGTLQVPVGEVADADASPYIRYLYPWTSGNAYKLTATWGSKTHEVVFKIGDEELKKLEAGQQLNVNVSLIANSLKVALTVSPWTVDDAVLDFSTEFNGLLNPASAGSVKLTADKQAVAVAGADRSATFSFKMLSPEGVRWNVHLENTVDFDLTGTTSGYGGEDAGVVTFGVEPKHGYDATVTRSVKLYITVEQPFGGTESEGIQVINPEENGIYRFPGTETEIEIRQVSESEFDGLTESVSIKE
mgnify:CR=1 FL=1